MDIKRTMKTTPVLLAIFMIASAGALSYYFSMQTNTIVVDEVYQLEMRTTTGAGITSEWEVLADETYLMYPGSNLTISYKVTNLGNVTLGFLLECESDGGENLTYEYIGGEFLLVNADSEAVIQVFVQVDGGASPGEYTISCIPSRTNVF